jgi:hypothetical protein
MGYFAANDRLSLWSQVFNNSRVNGAPYLGDDLPSHRWTWPTDTYLQRRLRALHVHTVGEKTTRADDETGGGQNDLWFSPAGLLDPGIARRDPQAGSAKKARKRKIACGVGAKQRSRSV